MSIHRQEPEVSLSYVLKPDAHLGRVELLRKMNGSRFGARDEHDNPVNLLYLKAGSLDKISQDMSKG